MMDELRKDCVAALAMLAFCTAIGGVLAILHSGAM